MTTYTLTPGAHLKVSKGLYSHHGIYVGNNQVIHYSGKSTGMLDFGAGEIEKISLTDFVANAELYVIRHATQFEAAEIVQSAHSRLGEQDYSLFFNNCEHFANWCVNGKSQSHQVTTGVLISSASISAASAAAASKTASTTASSIVGSKAASIVSSTIKGASVGGVTGSMLGATGGAAATAVGVAAAPAVLVTAAAFGVVGLVGSVFDWW